MASIDIHTQRSLARTGKEYREVHEWIDDPDKKPERHDLTRLLEFAEMWRTRLGEEAAREYLHHLQDDIEYRFNRVTAEMQRMTQEHLSWFGCVSEKRS
ncbi:MAG: hypothetical protein HQM01_09405 [Magnetococcales bacterium]|nr:hypothetical protein [Magnetococcales bacterium]